MQYGVAVAGKSVRTVVDQIFRSRTTINTLLRRKYN